MPRLAILLIAILLPLLTFPVQAQDRSVTLLNRQYVLQFPPRYEFFTKGYGAGKDVVIFTATENDVIVIYATLDVVEPICQVVNEEMKIVKIDIVYLPSDIRKFKCEGGTGDISIHLIAQDACGKNCTIGIEYAVKHTTIDWEVISMLESGLIKLSLE